MRGIRRDKVDLRVPEGVPAHAQAEFYRTNATCAAFVAIRSTYVVGAKTRSPAYPRKQLNPRRATHTTGRNPGKSDLEKQPVPFYRLTRTTPMTRRTIPTPPAAESLS